MKKIVLICFCLIQTIAFTQTDSEVNKSPFTLNVGIGFPDLLHIGVGYQIKQAHFGSSFGLLKNKMSICGDIYFHFGAKTQYTEQKLSYLRLGYNFYKKKGDYSTFEYSHVNIRIGRDFFEDKHVGVNFELGVALRVHQIEYNKHYPPPDPIDPSNFNFSPSVNLYKNTFLYPSAGLSIFYRI